MTQQGLRQASVRTVSGTTLTYEGDWHAMWDAQSIAAGTFNERMIRYANTKLSATYTNINDAMQALAVAAGATNFGSIGTYSFALGPVPANSIAPTLSPTTAGIGVLITCGQGTWSNTPTSYAYQWMRGGVDRSGETASTYTTVAGDDGTTITCKVRASNANGPAAGYTTTSNSCAVSLALLLDSYTAGATYSLRKLRTAYAGNCVRIRRSSDNAEQDFGFVSNVVDTAGIATFVGGGTGNIVTWYDQSGNSVDVTQATAANQPLYVASAANSKPTVRYVDATDQLAKPSITGTTLFSTDQATIMGVSDYDAAVVSNNMLFEWAGGSGGVKTHQPYSAVHYFFWMGTTQSVAETAGFGTGSHIVELVRTPAHANIIIIDGSTKVSGGSTPDPIIGTGTFYIGGGGQPYAGDIPELFILKTEIGSSARSTVRANMGAYYGITVV